MLRWRKDGSGMIATPYAEGGAFLKSDPAIDRPDLQLHFCIAIVDDHGRKLHMGYGFSCHVCVLRPHSRGAVGLSTADPLAPPRIDPRFLSDERDADLLLKGVRMMRGILEAPALAKYRNKEIYTAGVSSDAELMAHIRARADTIYHPVGTCKMGIDDHGRGRPAAQGTRAAGPARRRRFGDADTDRRQHQCADDHDRRKGGGHDQGRCLIVVGRTKARSRGRLRNRRWADPLRQASSIWSDQLCDSRFSFRRLALRIESIIS